jgi:hypothetical protein
LIDIKWMMWLGPQLPHLARSVPSSSDASRSRPENRVGQPAAGFVEPNSRPGDGPAEQSEARESCPGARRMAGGRRAAQRGRRAGDAWGRQATGAAHRQEELAHADAVEVQRGDACNGSMGCGRRRRRAARRNSGAGRPRWRRGAWGPGPSPWWMRSSMTGRRNRSRRGRRRAEELRGRTVAGARSGRVGAEPRSGVQAA